MAAKHCSAIKAQFAVKTFIGVAWMRKTFHEEMQKFSILPEKPSNCRRISLAKDDREENQGRTEDALKHTSLLASLLLCSRRSHKTLTIQRTLDLPDAICYRQSR